MSKNNNSNFDFENCFKINSYKEVQNFIKDLEKNTDNKAKIKDNIKIIHVIWEMKLRGIKISPANLSSHPTEATLDLHDDKNILMPLQSKKGIGEKGSKKIHENYKIIGEKIFEMSKEELASYKLENGKKAFSIKELEALFS